MTMIEPPVDEVLLKSLLEFEFPELRAKKALLATNNGSLDAAIEWITNHQVGQERRWGGEGGLELYVYFGLDFDCWCQ